jgi:hypothetical protein
MGLPVQETMDGRALVEIFDPQFVAANPVATDQIPEPEETVGSFDYTDEELASVQRELKSLGYL